MAQWLDYTALNELPFQAILMFADLFRQLVKILLRCIDLDVLGAWLYGKRPRTCWRDYNDDSIASTSEMLYLSKDLTRNHLLISLNRMQRQSSKSFLSQICRNTNKYISIQAKQNICSSFITCTAQCVHGRSLCAVLLTRKLNRPLKCRGPRRRCAYLMMSKWKLGKWHWQRAELP